MTTSSSCTTRSVSARRPSGGSPRPAPGAFAVGTDVPDRRLGSNYDAKALAVGDLEGDGRPDALVATSYGMAILIQNSGVLPSLGKAWVVDAQPGSNETNVAGCRSDDHARS